jgi:hypothetical protein
MPDYVPGRPVAPRPAGGPPGPPQGRASVPTVPERSIGVRISGLEPRIAPRSPFAAPVTPDRPTHTGPAATDLGAVLPQDAAPPPPVRQPVPAATGPAPAWSGPPAPGEVTCPVCARQVGADRRFCRCGATLVPPRPKAAESQSPPRLPWYRRLGEMIGSGRSFRRAMRAANGGMRASYDVARSARARFVRATVLLSMLGVGASQFGPWAPDLRGRATDWIDQVLPKQYEVVPTDPDAVQVEPAIQPIAGFDPAFAVDQNAERAWAAPWDADAAPADGQPCQRPGGTVALLIPFREEAAINRVVIRAGLAENNDKRQLQSRPKQVDILFSDGTCFTAELSDEAGGQEIAVEATASDAQLVIVDAYPPADAGDGYVSLSEVTFETRTDSWPG